MRTEYFLYWLAFANIVSFLQMTFDKRWAILGHRRISEASLLRWMTLGGAPGGLFASRLLRHKTRKQPFASTMAILFWLETVLLGLWLSGLLDPLIALVIPKS